MKKCEFCEKFDFATARTEVTKYGANILLTLCNTKFDKEEQFNFCPVCGRNLKDIEYHSTNTYTVKLKSDSLRAD